MSGTLRVDLVSPTKLLLSETVSMVVVPGTEGFFGVLADHMSFVSSLRPGVVSVHESVTAPPVKRFFVSGGFAEVNQQACTLLVDEAIPLEELASQVIEERRLAAEQKLEAASTDDDRASAEVALATVSAMEDALSGAA